MRRNRPSFCLTCQLHDGDPPENQRPDQNAPRHPGRKHHQGKGNPASTGGHPLGPVRGQHQRQIGPADPRHEAAEQHRGESHAKNRISKRVRAVVIVADGTKHQPGAGPFQEIGHHRHHRHRAIGKKVMREDKLADQRQVREDRKADLRQPFDRLADQRRAGKARQAGAEDRQRQPGGHLVRRESENKDAEEAGRQHAGNRPGHDAEDKGPADHGDPEGGDSPHQHHPFNAEIENTASLDHKLACGRIDKRHRGHQDGQDEILKHHLSPLPPLPAPPPREDATRRDSG